MVINLCMIQEFMVHVYSHKRRFAYKHTLISSNLICSFKGNGYSFKEDKSVKDAFASLVNYGQL